MLLRMALDVTENRQFKILQTMRNSDFGGTEHTNFILSHINILIFSSEEARTPNDIIDRSTLGLFLAR